MLIMIVGFYHRLNLMICFLITYLRCSLIKPQAVDHYCNHATFVHDQKIFITHPFQISIEKKVKKNNLRFSYLTSIVTQYKHMNFSQNGNKRSSNVHHLEQESAEFQEEYVESAG
jgi:hypothetical protein